MCYVVFILVKDFLVSHILPKEKARVAQVVGRGHSHDSWPKVARDTPKSMTSRSMYKLGTKLARATAHIGWQMVSNCIVNHLFCIF